MICPSGKRTYNPDSRKQTFHYKLATFDRGDYSYGLTPALTHAVSQANSAADVNNPQ